MPVPSLPALATLIRQWRHRLPPEDATHTLPGRRRTPGLRREELAVLAGVSVEYIVQLEQGRSRRPSPRVVSALADALRLNPRERDELYLAAGLQAPREALISDAVPDGVHRMISRWAHLPLAAFTAHWRLQRWTPAWSALFGDPARLSPDRRNLLRMRFARPDPRRPADFRASGEAFDRALVSDLRATVARYPDDWRLTSLIDDLSSHSARFRDLWSSGPAQTMIACELAVDAPGVGNIAVDWDIWRSTALDHRLVVVTARQGGVDHEKLLAVTGEPMLCPIGA